MKEIVCHRDDYGVYLAQTDSCYNQAADWLEGFGDRETVLVKTEDGYRFLSNHTVAE